LAFDDPLWVLTAKVARTTGRATVTLEGIVATKVFPLDKMTIAPPEGALELSVMVPVELFLRLTARRIQVSEEGVTAVTPASR
jgi:hypothetical protein